eukprot:superscaffoldBa00006714_g21826
MAAHYWSGCTDIFSRPDPQSGGRFSRIRRTQRYALPSLLLSRSRSQGQLNLEFGTPPQSASHAALDLQVCPAGLQRARSLPLHEPQAALIKEDDQPGHHQSSL